ncbi:MAG: maleylpyruvate isomerase N-terminal domain-containing protein [Acidimicrobiia bacterium]
MTATTILNEVRSALIEVSARTEGLVESLPDTVAPLPGSAWSVREAAVHLVTVGVRYAGMVHGESYGYQSLSPAECGRMNDELIADIPESDPGKLAALMRDGTGRLLEATAGGHDAQEVVWHCDTRITVPHLVGTAVAEHLLHGYDMAVATGRPWPIEPHHASLALFGYGPAYGLCLNPATIAGHSAGYGIDLGTGERFTIRFVDGEYSTEPPDSGPVDCTITADPVAFLLVGSGRLTQWEAIALGLLGAGGNRPELALSFTGRFLFP